MAYFGNYLDEAITTHHRIDDAPDLGVLLGSPEIATLDGRSARGPLAFATDRGHMLSENDVRDQFLIFQFSADEDGPRILETSDVAPALKGSSEEPDVRARIQLASFHVGKGEDIDKDTRATLRIDFGKDEKSDSPLDTVFWSIAAGLKLYNGATKAPAEAKDIQADFNQAFSRRPIEIPGGLGKLRFEVVKHREPKWYQKVFDFIQGDTGKALISAVGFPGVTAQAVGLIDELVNRLDKDDPVPLFQSRPMTLALSERARASYTGGIPGIEIGSLSPGFCLLARGRDFDTVIEHDPLFLASYGLLVPKGVSRSDFLANAYDDPFTDVTYAVLRVAMDTSKLDFNSGF